MILPSVGQKKFVIISDNSIIFNALRDNTSFPFQLFNSDYIKSINDIGKIDLLIVDKNVNSTDIPFYRVNTLINLTSKLLVKSEVNLHKPFKLKELLRVMHNNLQDKHLFCCINESWIYHQRLAKITSVDIDILFTDKENALFAELLMSKNFLNSKEYLRHKIWNYHRDSESTTVDTHLYKLKQKLPDGLIKITATECCLNINNFI